MWSVGSGDDPAYNNFLLQPFVNYNLPGGLYIYSAPVITANWNASGSQRWTVPLGVGVGKIFHFGPLPVNMQMGAYYNVVTPDNGATGRRASRCSSCSRSEPKPMRYATPPGTDGGHSPA